MFCANLRCGAAEMVLIANSGPGRTFEQRAFYVVAVQWFAMQAVNVAQESLSLEFGVMAPGGGRGETWGLANRAHKKADDGPLSRGPR